MIGTEPMPVSLRAGARPDAVTVGLVQLADVDLGQALGLAELGEPAVDLGPGRPRCTPRGPRPS